MNRRCAVAQALYTLAWSPNVDHARAPTSAGGKDATLVAATWLAYGGLAGFVRCTRVGTELHV